MNNLRDFAYADSDDVINAKDFTEEELFAFAVYYDDVIKWIDEAKKDYVLLAKRIMRILRRNKRGDAILANVLGDLVILNEKWFGDSS